MWLRELAHAKYMQVSCGLEWTLQLWVKRDKTFHAQSEYAHVTYISQLAINPRSQKTLAFKWMNTDINGRMVVCRHMNGFNSEKSGFLLQGFSKRVTLLRCKRRISMMVETFHIYIFSILFWVREAWFSVSEQLQHSFTYRCF